MKSALIHLLCFYQGETKLHELHRKKAQLRITACRRIGARSRRLGLRGAAAHRSAIQPPGPVGLGATSPTRNTLCAIALTLLVLHNMMSCEGVLI